MITINTMAVMGTGLSLLFTFTIATALIHEAGHAVAWTLAGARVREVGYGRPNAPALRINVGRLTIAFNPFTLFAYTVIEGSHEQFTSHSKWRRIFLHGAGIAANLLAAFLAMLWGGALAHFFAAFSAALAAQNILFQDGWRIFSAVSKS